MGDYPEIENHGLIGDLQTTALVCTDGTIDWMCVPRFDPPSVFASLLDQEKGGFFRIAPADSDGVVARQVYLPETPILITRILSHDGVGEVIDFMPGGLHPHDPASARQTDPLGARSHYVCG